MKWQTLYRQLAAYFRPHGLALLGATQVGRYNTLVDENARLPAPGGAESSVFLVGNTKALWEPFSRWWRMRPQSVDPLDTYIEEIVGAALETVPIPGEYRFVHRAEPHFFSAQTLAAVCGAGYLSPAHLIVHPRFGPWLALRAAIVVATPGPNRVRTEERPSRCDCAAMCETALKRAMDKARSRDAATMRATWRDWVAMRESCPVGRDWRYSEEQIRYHYLHERPAWLESV